MGRSSNKKNLEKGLTTHGKVRQRPYHHRTGRSWRELIDANRVSGGSHGTVPPPFTSEEIDEFWERIQSRLVHIYNETLQSHCIFYDWPNRKQGFLNVPVARILYEELLGKLPPVRIFKCQNPAVSHLGPCLNPAHGKTFRKLAPWDYEKILYAWWKGTKTQSELGKEYGVSQSSISQLIDLEFKGFLERVEEAKQLREAKNKEDR